MGGSLTQNSVVWGGGRGQLQDLALTTKCEGHPPPQHSCQRLAGRVGEGL